MPPTRAATAAAAAASTAGSMQQQAASSAAAEQTTHQPAAAAAASAADTAAASAEGATAAAMDMHHPTHAHAAVASAAAAGGPPRASPRLALKVQRKHSGGGAGEAEGASAASSALHTPTASNHAHSSAAMVDAITHPASSAAHGMHAPDQIPIVRSASEFTPGSGSGSTNHMMHSPPLSSRQVHGASTGVSPHCAGLHVSTPLTKRSERAAHSLHPSPMTLPPPTMPTASSGARRKLMGSGSNGVAVAAASAATCHGLPPSPLARAMPAVHMDRTSSTASTAEQAPTRKKTTARAAAAAAAAAAGSSSAAASARSASTPKIIRAQSCGEMMESQRHELRLPSRRELSVDYITPRVAAMVLLGQQQKNLANGAASPCSPASSSTLSALGALSPDESRQILEWSRSFDRVHVLDARFEYEYDGGHIVGAVNVTSLTQVEDLLGLWAPIDQSSPAEEAINQYQNATLSSPTAAAAAAAHQMQQPSTPSSGATTPAPILFGPRVCVLIHCEFSKKRGPKCFTFLRNRDRKLNLNRWPHLHYPEMYCIAGGYQAFFNQQPASPSAVGSALEVGGTTVAQSLCFPPAYISMTHKDFKAQYAVAWARMKKSSSNAPMAASPNSIYAQAYSPKSTTASIAAGAAGRASPAASADAVATPKSSGPPQRRTKGQTRPHSAISPDIVSGTASPVTLGRSLPLSAANLASPPPSLAAGAGAAAAVAVATGAAGLMGAPRSVRGLGVVLDGSAATTAAASGGAAAHSARSAFSFKRPSFGGGAAGSAASIHALTHSSSSPPFAASPSPISASSSASAAASGLFVPASPGPVPSPSPLAILPPSSSSFFGAGLGPCASPLLPYGWSTEGRSSTPSPFCPESPRITSSSGAPSPLSWSHLSSAQQIQQQQQAAAASYGRGTPTPLSMLSEDSPRAGAGLNHSLSHSRSRSSSIANANALSNPPVFVGAGSAAAQAQALAPAPAPAQQRASWGGFASPSSQVSRRSSVSASSPSSALHSMHLRSSPSPYSGGAGSSCNGSSSNTQPLSSRSSSSPSPALFYESSSVLATPRGPSLSNASTSSDALSQSQVLQHESPGELASAISGGSKLLLDSELPPSSNGAQEASSPSKKARYTRESTGAAAASASSMRGQPRSIAFDSAVPTATAAAAASSPCDESTQELPQCTEDMADD